MRALWGSQSSSQVGRLLELIDIVVALDTGGKVTVAISNRRQGRDERDRCVEE